MSVSADGSYFSRFFLKFIEIIAAGLATAVSGYLIAHLSGALSSPAPPSTSMLLSSPLQSNPPVSFDTNAQHATSQQEVKDPPVAQSGQMLTDSKKLESSPRKRAENAATAADSKHQGKSLLTRVRAALAKVDAKRTDPVEVTPRQGHVTAPSPVVAQPQAIGAPPAINTPLIGATTGPLIPGEVRSARTKDTRIDSNPLPTVEITSRPITEPRPPTEMSPLEQRLRQDPLIGIVDPPRPPMPIAE